MLLGRTFAQPGGGCLRSVVTCHCRSCSFIKLCLLLAPAPLVLPFAGGRALGVNWFCAEGSRGARERGGSHSAERSSALSGDGICATCSPLLPLGAAARGPSPHASSRRGRLAERSWFLPCREPAGPVQQAPSCGGRAEGASAAGVGLPAAASRPVPF